MVALAGAVGATNSNLANLIDGRSADAASKPRGSDQDTLDVSWPRSWARSVPGPRGLLRGAACIAGTGLVPGVVARPAPGLAPRGALGVVPGTYPMNRWEQTYTMQDGDCF